MKVWVLLMCLLILLVLVSTFVGIATWHMAYEEATFRGRINEELAMEGGRTLCKEVMQKILNQHRQEVMDLQESCSLNREKKIGIVGLDEIGITIVQGSIMDEMRYNLRGYQFEVITSMLLNESVRYQAEELNQTQLLQVFVGPGNESDLRSLISWARSRPHPQKLLVFVTPAVITDESFLYQEGDNHAIVQMREPPSSSVDAVLKQIQSSPVRKLFVLLSTELEKNYFQSWGDSARIEVIAIDANETTPSSDIVSQLEASIFLMMLYSVSELEEEDITQKNVGLLITKKYMFEKLSEADDNSTMFDITWFTIAEEVLYDNSLLDFDFFKFQGFTLNTALSVSSRAENLKWHHNTTKMLHKARNTHSLDMIKHIYDSGMIAAKIASRLPNNDMDLEMLEDILTWESLGWYGISGPLRIDTFKRVLGSYLDLQLKNNTSGQTMQFPSGVWKVGIY